MQPRPIREFFQERARPERVVLLGKGPSLDAYAPTARRIGEYVLGINEVPTIVPCDGVVYVDSLLDWEDYRHTRDVLRTSVSRNAHGGRGWHYMMIPVRIPGDSWEHVIPRFGPGTGTTAITILGEWGVKSVTLYGFDAMRGIGRVNGRRYAEVLGDSCAGAAANYNYGPHCAAMRKALAFYGIDWKHGNGAAD